jgi:hypothetical protein
MYFQISFGRKLRILRPLIAILLVVGAKNGFYPLALANERNQVIY